MNQLDEVLTAKLLSYKLARTNIESMSAIMDQPGVVVDADVSLRNLCCKFPVEFAEELDDMAKTMGVTKQFFIQTAIHAAMQRYRELYEELDVGDMDRLIELTRAASELLEEGC
jgi:predicted DNA-binding protein